MARSSLARKYTKAFAHELQEQELQGRCWAATEPRAFQSRHRGVEWVLTAKERRLER